MTSHSGGITWKYKVGLLLILTVVIIWVASAEVTQLIFEKYRHPFLLTWLGAALLSFYLPVAYLKEYCTPPSRGTPVSPHGAGGAKSHLSKFHRSSENLLHDTHKSISGPTGTAQKAASASGGLVISTSGSGGGHKTVSTSAGGAVHLPKSPHALPSEVEMTKAVLKGPAPVRARSPRPGDNESDEEEGMPLLSSSEPVGGGGHKHLLPLVQLSTREVAVVAMILAPIWLLTEYLSNAALSMTSVASTTILSSTSGLFTLLFGVTLGGENLSLGKVLAALVSIAGVMMTELGKSSASDDSTVFGDGGRNPGQGSGETGLTGHNLAGDICGLLSAVSYGFYTTLLRKYVGGEGGGEEKADLQKVFGFIGLFTLFGLWWLVFPLNLIGWEPIPTLPSTYGLDEDILANGLIGSMISDYFWAVSVVWTTPLVATLGLSLTIPLAMVADMVMHGRSYSLVYILGAIGVFGGFIVANLADDCWPTSNSEGCFSWSCCCCIPSWWRKPPQRAPTLGIKVDGDSVFSDKEID